MTALITDPAWPGRRSRTLAWAVDASRPSVSAELSRPVARSGGAYVFDDAFSMRLRPDAGAVAEFQVDGDGWFRYFGWPTDSSAPFRFTPLGTDIDHLVYGKLGVPARAVPWDPAVPGYGRHTDYRAVDGAGNIGPAKRLDVILRASRS